MSNETAGQQPFSADELHQLQRAWDAGKASGLAGEIDFGALRIEARRLLARTSTLKPDVPPATSS